MNYRKQGMDILMITLAMAVVAGAVFFFLLPSHVSVEVWPVWPWC